MSQTQTSTVPGYIKGPTKDAIKDIDSWLGSDQNYVYGSKKGEDIYTGMNGMQKGAIGNVDWLADQDLNDMFGLNKASGLWDQYAEAGPELANKQGFTYDVTKGLDKAANLSTTGIMDENGPLGSLMSYMSPYLEQVLNPQLREIQEESDRQRRNIGAQATMAGAFGDARHGVMEGENFEKTNQAVADTTGKTTADAFLNALAQRQADMGRMDTMKIQDAGLADNALARQLQGDIQSGQFRQAGSGMDQQVELANQAARQNATERLATAGQAAQSIGNNSLQNFQSVNDALMNAGNVTQAQQELKRKTQQQFQEALASKDYNSAIRLLQAANGAPKEGTVTTESTDGLFGILGSVLGGIF